MIQIITGKLGAGKTLWSVTQMYDVLTQGRTVVTNIDLDWDFLVKLARRHRRVVLDPRQLIRIDPANNRNWQEDVPFADPFSPLEVWLDEIHLFYNARDWQKSGQECGELFSFLTQSRKAGVNVSFIVQDEATLEKQFRMQAEWLMYVVSSDHMSIAALGKLPFKFFFLVKRSAKTGNLLGKKPYPYNRKFFGAYKTHSFLDPYMRKLSENKPRIQKMKLERISVLRWVWESIAENTMSIVKRLHPLHK